MTTSDNQFRYTKTDKFNNLVWFCDADIDKKNFDKLVCNSKKLTDAFPNSFSPLYFNEKYKNLTIRTDAVPGVEMSPGAIYNVNYKTIIKRKIKNGQQYIRLVLSGTPLLVIPAPEEKEFKYD
jgi:hypothetical protein